MNCRKRIKFYTSLICIFTLLAMPQAWAEEPIKKSIKEIIKIENIAITKEIPLISNSKNKTYMDYQTITNEDSLQWKYIHESGNITIDENGYLKNGDFIGVALGEGLGEIGDKFIVELEGQKILKLVMIEVKANVDTCNKNFVGVANDDVIEFVVDTSKMQDKIYENGYVYGGNFNNREDFSGEIVKIEKIIYVDIIEKYFG